MLDTHPKFTNQSAANATLRDHELEPCYLFTKRPTVRAVKLMYDMNADFSNRQRCTSILIGARILTTQHHADFRRTHRTSDMNRRTVDRCRDIRSRNTNGNARRESLGSTTEDCRMACQL
jgi:hypothetical protein